MKSTLSLFLSVAAIATATPLPIPTESTGALPLSIIPPSLNNYPSGLESYTSAEVGYSAGIDIGSEIGKGNLAGAIEDAIPSNLNVFTGILAGALGGPHSGNHPPASAEPLSNYSPEVKGFTLGADAGKDLANGQVVPAATDYVSAVLGGASGIVQGIGRPQ
ncbi:hypothetical protein BOTBODRAFT_179574 [Botryobasidium botryosum FD-172 SS1]|uniref:Uncharacterized protein n=1 Tax=Botryobasidium botryosum (strain FD-172 SS1) TaxID=930990 RepID=A0A067MB16_BOTB1|nr:hypothetical protein BOTBODRAFT_179574 [Botryobasidium botryosum FD-172 SS1]